MNIAVTFSQKESAAQIGLREATLNHPYSSMQILPEQARLLALVGGIISGETIIELGVFTGYSALSMAQALPHDGFIYACDHHPDWPKLGLPFWQQASVDHKIEWIREDALVFTVSLARSASRYDFHRYG